MKIEIKVQDLKIQAGFSLLKNGNGIRFSVYFFSGDRYQHGIKSTSYGLDGLYLYIEDYENDVDKGSVSFIPETEAEKALFDFAKIRQFNNRDKETEEVIFIKKDLVETDAKTFEYIRNFTP